jgi:hypothetical protein
VQKGTGTRETRSLKDKAKSTYVMTAVLAGWVVMRVKVCCGRVLVAVKYAVEPCVVV